jgi:hypothetical protein
MVETTFTRNHYVEDQMHRVNHIPAPDEAYEMAVGDDSFLVRDNSQAVACAYSPTEAFESEDEEVIEVMPHSQRDRLQDERKKKTDYQEPLIPPASGFELQEAA